MSIFSEGLVNVAERYLRKGSKVYIEGQLRTRKWQDQQGQDRYTTEVVLQGFDAKLVMLDGREGGGSSSGGGRGEGSWGASSGSYDDGGFGGSGSGGGSGRGGAGARTSGPSFDNDLDDEVPF